MKTIHPYTKLLAICVFACLSRSVTATTLDVPYYEQVCPEWCWNASAEMVLAYYGTTEGATYADGQAAIAAYASGGRCDPNYLYGSGPCDTKVYYWTTNSCDAVSSFQTNGTPPTLYGDDFILKHFGNINSQSYNRPLTTDELQSEIDAGRPVLIAIRWLDNSAHIIVLIGFDGTIVDINDPWPCDGVLHLTYDTLKSCGSREYTPNSDGEHWAQSLTTGASLDLVFLIDSTGSMYDEIDAVKAAAQSFIMNTFSNFTAARVAVIDYRDNPDWTGDYTDDYIFHVDTTFTTNVNTAVNAVNPIYANGGGDIPEAVYSAMYDTLQGAIIGGWRPEPTPRLVIVMSDAGGHDPIEPWVGGHSMADVIALANTPGNQITIVAVACGVEGGDLDPDCVADLGGMAGGTGGSMIEAGSAGLVDVAGGINQAVNQATGGNYPIGSVAAFQPKFSFNLTGIGMGKVPSYYKIQILQSNAVKKTWSTYLTAKLTTNTYTPTKPMSIGTYQWRIGFEQPASTITSPSGTVLGKIKAAFIYENNYTEFQREQILPGDATIVSPSSYFVATNKSQTYVFDAGVNASSYYIVITDNTKGKVFKKLTVKPPKANPNASPLSVKVTGHTVGHYYSWTIESLNFDHPKP